MYLTDFEKDSCLVDILTRSKAKKNIKKTNMR